MTRTDRVHLMRRLIATRLHESGVHGSDLRSQRQLHAYANLIVMQEVGVDGVQRLDTLIRSAVSRMWGAIVESRIHTNTSPVADTAQEYVDGNASASLSLGRAA